MTRLARSFALLILLITITSSCATTRLKTVFYKPQLPPEPEIVTVLRQQIHVIVESEGKIIKLEKINSEQKVDIIEYIDTLQDAYQKQ
jgi:hypothetical protein